MQATHPQRLGKEDLNWMSELLTEAFLFKPPITKLFPTARQQKQTREFMRCVCNYALLFGECYTTTERQGVALWLPPNETSISLRKMIRAGILPAPIRLGPRAFYRVLRFTSKTGKTHKAAASVPHYYLMMLGVRPSEQGKGVGKLLVRHGLELAARQQVPTYLETQTSDNVGIYQRMGFEVVDRGILSNMSDFCNWGMLHPAITS